MNNKTEYLAKSDLYRILSRGFSYPDRENISELRLIITEFRNCYSSRKVTGYLGKALRFMDYSSLQREYSSIFLKGTIANCESSYVTSLNTIPDVAAYYKAFGISAKPGESPDSITYELQFLSLLALKSYLAKTEEEEEVTEDAYSSFLREHLQNFAPRFIGRLKERSDNQFYLVLADVLGYMLQEELKTTPSPSLKIHSLTD